MITYSWTIKNLEYTNDDDKGVLLAQWAFIGSDEEHSAQISGFQSLEPNPQAESYIPFEELTEEDVVSWIKNILGEEDLAKKEQVIAQKIQEQKTPKVQSGLPWINLNK